MDNGDKIKIHEDIAVLKTQMRAVLVNHLPHINRKLNWIFGTTILALLSIIYVLLDKVIN